MQNESKLGALLTEACAGGNPAARERAFEEVLRLLSIFVRSSMGPGLRRNRESIDICQTVAKSLVGDLRDGKLSFPNEAALIGYLQTVVRSKLAEVARRDKALKRGGHINHDPRAAASIDADSAPGSDPTASQHAMGREATDRAGDLIDEQEAELIRLRQAGMSWEQISEHTGRSAVALRKEWSRLQARMKDSLD